MVQMTINYTGDKRCELTHGPSNTIIYTDAPRDNFGKGQSFSPTDLLSVSLGACMLTVMAIHAEKNNIKLEGSKIELKKEMQLNPRKVAQIHVALNMKAEVTKEMQAELENIAHNCPVKLSLSSEIKIPITFHWES